jgi:hypothetical protein
VRNNPKGRDIFGQCFPLENAGKIIASEKRQSLDTSKESGVRSPRDPEIARGKKYSNFPSPPTQLQCTSGWEDPQKSTSDSRDLPSSTITRGRPYRKLFSEFSELVPERPVSPKALVGLRSLWELKSMARTPESSPKQNSAPNARPWPPRSRQRRGWQAVGLRV